MREIISVHLGKAGCQIGEDFWAQIAAEHAVLPDGTRVRETTTEVRSFSFK